MATQPSVFRPPHCPNSQCPFHLSSTGWRYRHAGYYCRQARPQRIRRYRCTHCRRYFSTQTFSPTYWLKRPDLLPQVYSGQLSCAAHRQLARFLCVSPSTIMNQCARLGRHCLLFHQLHRPRRAPREEVVVDGFETFEFSQYFPLHLNLAVGADSHFLYAFTDAPLRRKGSMRPEQKRRRAELERQRGRPDPQAVEKSMRALVELVTPAQSRIRMHSDEHPAYPRAFRKASGVEVVHRRTPSKAARTARNPLFPVNRMDLLLRHCGAHHKRETIAYSKRRQRMLERLAIFAVWVNYMKSFSEKRQDATPAQRLGRMRTKLSLPALLSRRLFPHRVGLPKLWETYYRGELVTRCLPNGRPHELRYAF